LLIRAPSPKLRGMSKATALHMIVRHLDHQFGSQRLPRQVLSLTPTALRAGNAAGHAVLTPLMLGPMFPGMTLERVFSIRRQKIHELHPHLIAETRAHTDVLQC